MKPIYNTYAKSQYEFLDSVEAGLVLSGAEVKAVKKGQMSLKGAYVGFEDGVLWLKEAHISAYQQKNQPGYNPDRPRRVLLHKKQILTLQGKLSSSGLTLVPQKVYSTRGLVKLQISLVRGLKKHDKRQKIKERDINRSIARTLRQKA